MPHCRKATVCRLALLLGTTALMSLSADRAVAACFFVGGGDFQCTGASGGTTIVGGPNANVMIGDTGSDTNATFSPGLTINGSAINVTFATTTTPSNFAGNGGLQLSQSGPGNINITGMNAVMNLTGGVGIEVTADTPGGTTIETVPGGTITTPGDGILYTNTNATPGNATITIGAAILAGNIGVAVSTPNVATNTVNLNAEVKGSVEFVGGGNSTAILNVADGVLLTGSAAYNAVSIKGQASATITNSGTIAGTTGRTAVYADSATVLNNNASGTITADATGFAFDQQGTGKTLTVTNAGTLTGSGSNIAGSTVTVTNSGTWNPNRNSAFSGTATLSNSGGFDSGAFTTALSNVVNSGTVNIRSGGRLNTSGSYAQGAGITMIATGSTLVASGGYSQSGGTTTVDGTLASAVSLSGGTLGGNGTIAGSLMANAGATVSPGNSIGSLTVNGNATFATGSIYRAEIQGATSDLLTVSGTASLAGTIQLVAGGGSYNFNTPYTVLTANGGVSGSFGTVTTSGSFGAAVTSEVGYTGTSVEVTLKPGSLVDTSTANPRYSTASGLSLNSWSVAAAIDRAVANGADPSFLYQVYARTDRQALLAALRTLTGEIHSTTGALGLSSASGFLTAALDPFAPGRDPAAMPNAAGAFGTAGAYASSSSRAEVPAGKGPRIAPQSAPDGYYRAWGQIFGSKSRSGADIALGTAASDSNGGHVAIGVDLHVLPGSVIGAAVAAGEARSKLSGNLGDAKADILQAGLYGMTTIGALSLGAALGYASADTQASRAIPLVAAFAVKSRYRSDIWSGRAEAAYRLFEAGGVALSPYGAFTAQHVRTPGFSERDALTGAPTGLAVAGRSGTTARAELGLRLDATATLFGLPGTAFGKLGWGYYAKRDNQFSASLVGLPGSTFTFQGSKPDRNAALVSTGIDLKITPAISLGARFDGEFSANAESYAGAATLKISF